jgi:hypothetical protein
MNGRKTWLSILVVLAVIILSSCGGDGDGTTSPTIMDVGGVWAFVGQLSSNTCVWLNVQIGEPLADTFTITQDGTNLTGVDSSGNLLYAGNISGDSFNLTQTNPDVQDFGGCTVSIGSNIAVDLTNDTSGTGTLSLTTTGTGACAPLSLPCSTVYSGSWSKTSSAKRLPQTGERVIQSYQRILQANK